MVYSLARVGAALGMRVEDYYLEGRRAWFRLHEKGRKRHEVAAHHNADSYLHAYVEAAGIASEKKSPLFRSACRFRSGRAQLSRPAGPTPTGHALVAATPLPRRAVGVCGDKSVTHGCHRWDPPRRESGTLGNRR